MEQLVTAAGTECHGCIPPRASESDRKNRGIDLQASLHSQFSTGVAYSDDRGGCATGCL
ncbi:hypothetical protein D3C87_2077670 [compost metagenome]